MSSASFFVGGGGGRVSICGKAWFITSFPLFAVHQELGGFPGSSFENVNLLAG